MWVPKQMPMEVELIDCKYRAVLALTDGGTLYARWSPEDNPEAGVTLVVSDDWGATWSEVHNFGGNIKQAHKMPDGAMLVMRVDGKIYRSDASLSNWTQVHDTGKAFWDGFGVRVWQNIVLVAEYGQNGRRVHMSRDQGQTWSVIFTHPDSSTSLHIHDVAYDPYEGIIWVATGDRPPRDLIFWSDDWGATWNGLPPGEYRRVTQIIPLPKCVLFGTDDHHLQGVFRHDRPKEGTMMGPTVNPYIAWSTRKTWRSVILPDSMTWMTRAAIRYGENAAAYFGFLQNRSVTYLPNQIWGTKDGYNFVLLWEEDQIYHGQGASVMAVFDPIEDGTMCARILRPTEASKHWIVKFNEPEWVAL